MNTGTSAEAALMGAGGAIKVDGLKKAVLKGAEQPHEASQAPVPTRIACCMPHSSGLTCATRALSLSQCDP